MSKVDKRVMCTLNPPPFDSLQYREQEIRDVHVYIPHLKRIVNLAKEKIKENQWFDANVSLEDAIKESAHALLSEVLNGNYIGWSLSFIEADYKNPGAGKRVAVFFNLEIRDLCRQ